jgi:hypothetical protein
VFEAEMMNAAQTLTQEDIEHLQRDMPSLFEPSNLTTWQWLPIAAFHTARAVGALSAYKARPEESGTSQSRKVESLILFAAFFFWGRPDLLPRVPAEGYWKDLLDTTGMEDEDKDMPL